MDFLAQLEQSGFSAWVRQSPSVWAYPTILTLHTIGLGFLVGTSSAISLRIIGVGSLMPLAPMGRFFPVMWVGFWINAISGTALFAAGATSKIRNPAFIIKLIFIALAIVNMRLLRRHVFRDRESLGMNPVPIKGRILACTSLFLWAGAITAGRLMAYVGY